MSSEEEEEVPEAVVCEQLCQEFAHVTNTDTALGHFFLQDANWNLEAALNRYFHSKEGSSGDSVTYSAPTDSSGSSNTACSSVTASSSVRNAGDHQKIPLNAGDDQKVLRLLSWNIDGLDQNGGCSIRTKAVCTIVLKEKPTIAFLQEVIDDSVSILADYLSDEYWVLKGKQPGAPCGAYYTAMLLKRDAVELGQEPEVIPFSATLMDRNLLKIEVKVHGTPCILMTSHLESTKQCVKARVEQLRHCFQILKETIPADATAFFGGDLNLRDSEVDQVGGIPNGMEDLWISCGSLKEYQYTWNCVKNDNLNAFEGAQYKPKARFDRIYVKHCTADSGPVWKPHTFRFVGTQRIQKYGRFPSDHWGIMCDLVKVSLIG